jgi:hypothetical protein
MSGSNCPHFASNGLSFISYQFALFKVPDADIFKGRTDGVFAFGIVDNVGVSTGNDSKDGAGSVPLIGLDHSGVSREGVCGGEERSKVQRKLKRK